MMDPLISVIVPVYNVEPFIRRCVESILNQSYKNLEIILVDDGSTDRCGELCEILAETDSRIKVVHQQNKGLSGARNTGLRIAKGEYLSFIDSDDAVSHFFYEMLVGIAESQNADIVSCDRVDVYEEQLPPDAVLDDYAFETLTREKAFEYLVNNRVFYQTVWDKLYRREVLRDLWFIEGKLHEDEFFTWKVLQNCNKVIHVSAPMYFYFHRKGSIMETFSIGRLDFFQARYERHLFIVKTYPDLLIASKASIEFPCILMMQRLLKFKDRSLKAKGKEILNDYYNKCRFWGAELKDFPISYSVNFYLANVSLELCAWLRNILGRKS